MRSTGAKRRRAAEELHRCGETTKDDKCGATSYKVDDCLDFNDREDECSHTAIDFSTQRFSSAFVRLRLQFIAELRISHRRRRESQSTLPAARRQTRFSRASSIGRGTVRKSVGMKEKQRWLSTRSSKLRAPRAAKGQPIFSVARSHLKQSRQCKRIVMRGTRTQTNQNALTSDVPIIYSTK